MILCLQKRSNSKTLRSRSHRYSLRVSPSPKLRPRVVKKSMERCIARVKTPGWAIEESQTGAVRLSKTRVAKLRLTKPAHSATQSGWSDQNSNFAKMVAISMLLWRPNLIVRPSKSLSRLSISPGMAPSTWINLSQPSKDRPVGVGQNHLLKLSWRMREMRHTCTKCSSLSSKTSMLVGTRKTVPTRVNLSSHTLVVLAWASANLQRKIWCSEILSPPACSTKIMNDRRMTS